MLQTIGTDNKFVFAMDALFGLPRKRSAGVSYRDPLHRELFFCKQPPVDLFVEESAMSRKPIASGNVSGKCICCIPVGRLGVGPLHVQMAVLL